MSEILVICPECGTEVHLEAYEKHMCYYETEYYDDLAHELDFFLPDNSYE